MLLPIQHSPLSHFFRSWCRFLCSFLWGGETTGRVTKIFRRLWNGGFYCDGVTGILQGNLGMFSFVHVRKDTTQWETCVKMEKRCGEQIWLLGQDFWVKSEGEGYGIWYYSDTECGLHLSASLRVWKEWEGWQCGSFPIIAPSMNPWPKMTGPKSAKLSYSNEGYRLLCHSLSPLSIFEKCWFEHTVDLGAISAELHGNVGWVVTSLCFYSGLAWCLWISLIYTP